MSSVWVQRINRYVERLYNIKGSPTVFDIAPEIRVVEPLPVGNEERPLLQWNRFSTAASPTGGAAQNAGVQIRNPIGSNVIAVIEKIDFRIGPATGSAVTLTLLEGAVSANDLASAMTPVRLDTRINTGSAMVPTQSTNTAPLTNVVAYTSCNSLLVTSVINSPNQEFVLLPGMALRIVDNTVAETFQCTMWWRERAMEASEST